MTKIGDTGYTELHQDVPNQRFRNRDALMFHDLVHPDTRARFAMSMIERWGMVSARPGGQDGDPADLSAKRMTNMSVTETVDRACALAEEAFAAFERRGWMLKAPTWDDISGKEEED